MDKPASPNGAATASANELIHAGFIAGFSASLDHKGEWCFDPSRAKVGEKAWADWSRINPHHAAAVNVSQADALLSALKALLDDENTVMLASLRESAHTAIQNAEAQWIIQSGLNEVEPVGRELIRDHRKAYYDQVDCWRGEPNGPCQCPACKLERLLDAAHALAGEMRDCGGSSASRSAPVDEPIRAEAERLLRQYEKDRGIWWCEDTYEPVREMYIASPEHYFSPAAAKFLAASNRLVRGLLAGGVPAGLSPAAREAQGADRAPLHADGETKSSSPPSVPRNGMLSTNHQFAPIPDETGMKPRCVSCGEPETYVFHRGPWDSAAIPSSAPPEQTDLCRCGHSGEVAHAQMDNLTGKWKRPCTQCLCGDYRPDPPPADPAVDPHVGDSNV